MDFHRQDKKVDFVERFIFHKACICPTQREEWSGMCSSTFRGPILQILLFFWQMGQAIFLPWCINLSCMELFICESQELYGSQKILQESTFGRSIYIIH